MMKGLPHQLVIAMMLLGLIGCDTPKYTGQPVCAEDQRDVLVSERLAPQQPSTVFELGAKDSVFAAVLSDTSYDPSLPVSSVTKLYVIEDGKEPDIESLEKFRTPTDKPILFAELREYRLVSATPGSYRLYSLVSPVIEVVRCPSRG